MAKNNEGCSNNQLKFFWPHYPLQEEAADWGVGKALSRPASFKDDLL